LNNRFLPRIPDHRKGLVYIVIAALLWSSSGLFIKVLTLTAFQISFFRSLVAAITIVLVLRFQGRKPEFHFRWTDMVCTLCYALTVILFVAATKLTTAANAIFLQFTAPIYLLFLEPWVFQRAIMRQDVLAVTACMGGMALFFAGHLALGGMLGNLLAILSGLCLATFSIILKWQRVANPREDPISAIILGNLTVGLICLPFVFPVGVNLGQAVSLVYLGIFQLGISFMLFTAGQRYVSATAAAITSMLEAVFNPVWVFLGIGEKPSPFALAGAVVVMGVILWYNLRRPNQPQPA
jgi:drug/metabolite transporter (DMT)-like permease